MEGERLVRRESGRVRGWECDVMVRRRLDERVQAAQASARLRGVSRGCGVGDGIRVVGWSGRDNNQAVRQAGGRIEVGVANDTGKNESKAVERSEMRRVVLFGGGAAMCCCASASSGQRVAWQS